MKKRMIAILMVVVFALLSAAPAFAVPSAVSYSSTRDFLEVLDSEGVHYTYEGIDSDDDEKVNVSYNITDTSIAMRIFFDDSRESCHIRVWNLIDYRPEDEGRVIEALDDLNKTYKWIKFYSDKNDNSVTASMDVILRRYDVGEICSEAMHRVVNICDDAYPTLKKFDKNAR